MSLHFIFVSTYFVVAIFSSVVFPISATSHWNHCADAKKVSMSLREYLYRGYWLLTICMIGGLLLVLTPLIKESDVVKILTISIARFIGFVSLSAAIMVSIYREQTITSWSF